MGCGASKGDQLPKNPGPGEPKAAYLSPRIESPSPPPSIDQFPPNGLITSPESPPLSPTNADPFTATQPLEQQRPTLVPSTGVNQTLLEPQSKVQSPPTPSTQQSQPSNPEPPKPSNPPPPGVKAPPKQPQPPPPVKAPELSSKEPNKWQSQPEDPGEYWTTSAPSDQSDQPDLGPNQFQPPPMPQGPYWLGFPPPGPPGYFGPVGPPDAAQYQSQTFVQPSAQQSLYWTSSAPSDGIAPPNSIAYPNPNQYQSPPPMSGGPIRTQSQPPVKARPPGASGRTRKLQAAREAQHFTYTPPATQSVLLNQNGPTKPESPSPF